ncbi:extensin-like [Haliotis rubra]|uniref:extensin-like n=1 Tax=Haliotis rubra TaxID=36100 RepID=UPI001EE5D7A5|nr:extensin-like [Haliotis rubra]
MAMVEVAAPTLPAPLNPNPLPPYYTMASPPLPASLFFTPTKEFPHLTSPIQMDPIPINFGIDIDSLHPSLQTSKPPPPASQPPSNSTKSTKRQDNAHLACPLKAHDLTKSNATKPPYPKPKTISSYY